jgi:hypothetical protein
MSERTGTKPMVIRRRIAEGNAAVTLRERAPADRS